MAKNKSLIARRIPRASPREETPLAATKPNQAGYKRRNQLRTLDSLDQRTNAAKQAHRLVAQLTNDLGNDPSTAERELIQHAAIVGAILEDCEVNWLERKPCDLTTYGQLIDRQRRIFECLGIKRAPRDVNGGRVPTSMSQDQFGQLVTVLKESVT